MFNMQLKIDAIDHSIIKYIITHLPINSLKAWFINLIKVLSALVKLKGITNHSYNPYLVLMAVFISSHSLILI